MARSLRVAIAEDEKESQKFFVETLTRLGHGAAITAPLSRFDEFWTLQTEASGLKQALENRKTIEPAKGTLMKQASLRVPSPSKTRQAATTRSLPTWLR